MLMPCWLIVYSVKLFFVQCVIGEGNSSSVVNIVNSRMVDVVADCRDKERGLVLSNFQRIEGGIRTSQYSEIEVIDTVSVAVVCFFSKMKPICCIV